MLSVLLASVVVCGAAAAEPVIVLDRSLKATTGELVSLRDGGAVVSVGGKDVQVANAAAVVAASAWGPDRLWPGLPRSGAGDPEADGVLVELTDGSRLRGDLMAGKGDSLVLVSRKLGKVEFPLDALRTLSMVGAEASPDAKGGKSDSVRMLNGDRIEGFIESIALVKGEGGSSLAVTVERDKVKTAVPLERVAVVSVQGGSAKKPEMTVWLAGGEKSGASEFSVEKGEARVVRTKGSLPAIVKGDAVTGAILASDALTPLSACTPKGSVETGSEQTLGTRDLTIPEPGTVSWELPKGAKKISGWAVLPEECRQWGDCTVTIACGATGTESKLAEFALNSAASVVQINHEVPAGAARLTVTVGEGKNGPVQDRVTLRRVLIGQ